MNVFVLKVSTKLLNLHLADDFHNGNNDMYNATSPMHGYERNIVINAVKMVARRSGFLCNLIVKGNRYKIVAFIWNV